MLRTVAVVGVIYQETVILIKMSVNQNQCRAAVTGLMDGELHFLLDININYQKYNHLKWSMVPLFVHKCIFSYYTVLCRYNDSFLGKYN